MQFGRGWVPGAVATLGMAMPPSAQTAAPALASIFADHAVLQRDRPIMLGGSAAPGARVTIKPGDRTASIRAGADGKWRATLPAMAAGGPHTLEVSGTADVGDRFDGADLPAAPFTLPLR